MDSQLPAPGTPISPKVTEACAIDRDYELRLFDNNGWEAVGSLNETGMDEQAVIGVTAGQAYFVKVYGNENQFGSEPYVLTLSGLNGDTFESWYSFFADSNGTTIQSIH